MIVWLLRAPTRSSRYPRRAGCTIMQLVLFLFHFAASTASSSSVPSARWRFFRNAPAPATSDQPQHAVPEAQEQLPPGDEVQAQGDVIAGADDPIPINPDDQAREEEHIVSDVLFDCACPCCCAVHQLCTGSGASASQFLCTSAAIALFRYGACDFYYEKFPAWAWGEDWERHFEDWQSWRQLVTREDQDHLRALTCCCAAWLCCGDRLPDPYCASYLFCGLVLNGVRPCCADVRARGPGFLRAVAKTARDDGPSFCRAAAETGVSCGKGCLSAAKICCKGAAALRNGCASVGQRVAGGPRKEAVGNRGSESCGAPAQVAMDVDMGGSNNEKQE